MRWQTVREHLDASLDAIQVAVKEPAFAGGIIEAARVIADSLRAGGKVLACGNGGSAADAQHFVAELVGSYRLRDRPGLAALALTTDTSVLTAVANDYGYERVFSRQVVALGRAGDVLFALSTSGESENIIRAAEQAKIEGMRTVGLTGRAGGRLAALCDVCIYAPTDSTPIIQQLHQIAYHAICAMVEEEMFGGVA